MRFGCVVTLGQRIECMRTYLSHTPSHAISHRFAS